MKQIFVISILIIFFSCTKKEKIISDDNISKLSEGNYRIPSVFGNLDLYVLLDNNIIIVTNADYLNYVYEKHYMNKFKSYNDFLSRTLNQKFKLNKRVFDNIPFKIFKINEAIEKEYNETAFEDFFKKYSKKDKSRMHYYILNLPKETTNDEVMTISYYFYLNGYQIMRNDYFPKYIIHKRDEIMKKR